MLTELASGILGTVQAIRDTLRADAAGVPSSPLGSLLWRWRMSGWLGNLERQTLTARSGLAHRVIWCVPEDALAEGWSTDDDEGADVTDRIDTALSIPSVLRQAWAAAREGGVGYIWIVPLNGDFMTPWREGEEPAAVHAVSYDEATVLEQETDPRSLSFGEPKVYSIYIHRDGMSYPATRVHASRVIRVLGAGATPSQEGPQRGASIPVLDLYRSAIEDLETGRAGVGRLLDRLSMPTIVLPPGAEAAASGGNRAKLAESMATLSEGMSTHKLMVLLNGSDFSWKGPSMAGAVEAFAILYQCVSLVEGIPISRLAGQPPGGLSTDDEAGRRAYGALLAQGRKHIAEPALLQLYQRILGPDPSRTIRWPVLEQPTAMEAATIAQAFAARDQALVVGGVVSPEEARDMLRQREPGLIPDVDPPALGLMNEDPAPEELGAGAATEVP